MKISVIMPSYLEDYLIHVGTVQVKSAVNRDGKFIRAVNSFVDQEYKDCELIIVSDGCKKTVKLYEKHFSKYQNIKLKKTPKQSMFSGKVRQKGIENATGEWIVYLDSDDVIGTKHLSTIVRQLRSSYKWVYYNDYLMPAGNILFERNIQPILGRIGTSCFSHRKDLNLVWQNGYNHDWATIQKYLLHESHSKIKTCEYYVCHFAGMDY